jgi:hypothetical protein
MPHFHFALLLGSINISMSIRREQCGVLPKRPKYLRQIGYMHVCSRIIFLKAASFRILLQILLPPRKRKAIGPVQSKAKKKLNNSVGSDICPCTPIPWVFIFPFYKSECMYVCMFRHNYLSVNGIVSFLSFTWRKSISRKKCGILLKGPKCLRKYVCSSLAVARQRAHDSLLKATQRFRNHGYIDGNNSDVIKGKVINTWLVKYHYICSGSIGPPFWANPTENGPPALHLLLCAYIIRMFASRCLDIDVLCDSVSLGFKRHFTPISSLWIQSVRKVLEDQVCSCL